MSSFEQRSLEGLVQQAANDRYIFVEQLLLEIDCVRRDDRFAFLSQSIEDRGHKIRQGLAYPGSSFHYQMMIFGQGFGNSARHPLLFGTEFETFCAGQ